MDSKNVPYASVAGNASTPAPGERPSQLAGVTRLLVLAPNWLGDAVMALPALADLRRAAPGATIAVAARPHVAPLFTMVPGVDEILTFGTRRSLNHDVEAIRTGGFEAAILFPNSWRTAFVAWRAGVPERWGYRTSLRGPLLTMAPMPPADVHQAVYYQQLAVALGARRGPLVPSLTVKEAARAAAQDLLSRCGWDGERPLVAIAPGAAYGSAKRWPATSYASLTAALAEDGAAPVLIGGPADRAGGEEVVAGLRPGTSAIDLIGKTDIPTLAGVLVRCRTVVSNDSGAMHLAAALGVPVTAFFGPTDEEATHPIGSGPSSVLTHKVWCRPCMLRECPLDHRCMNGISVDAALQTVRRSL